MSRIPLKGSVYIDTPILIYSLERHPVFLPRLHEFWKAVERGDVIAHVSEFVYLEAYVLPIRMGKSETIRNYDRFLASGAVKVHSITREVLSHAARLRAEFSTLRAPDALHAATAINRANGVLLTNDHALAKLSAIDGYLID